ncbi:hypothetical protein [Streptococcus porcinus]|uniref:hypothetical protein n=1 Tax=Streptococcus porcinus TaxID=1340 RepID=UPI001960D2D5|nr:hypothetical protein [Streptococcus porcinus]
MNFRTKVLFRLDTVSSSVLLLPYTILPTVNVFAGTIAVKKEQRKELNEIAPNDNINLSEEKKQLLIQEVKNKYPNVSEEFISGVTENYLPHNYTFPREQGRVFRSAWQVFTVDQTAAALDVLIGIALTRGVESIVSAVLKVGKRKDVGRVKSILIKYGIGHLVSDSIIDYAINLTSPGYRIAKYIDIIDKVPNNNRINV